jgi:LysM repeat protein
MSRELATRARCTFADVDLDALKAANGRDDPDLIAVGEELRIPRSD